MQPKITFNHSCPIQIRFTDIDLMEHVTNSLYLAYCDIARMKYFNEVLGEKIGQKEVSLVIASITIDFISPIFQHEKIEVLTKASKIGNKSIHTLQHIVNSDNGEIKATVKSAIAGFDYHKQESIVVPEKWKQKLAEYDKDVEYKHSQTV
jgi:acyl-CoA thioester hydrolase